MIKFWGSSEAWVSQLLDYSEKIYFWAKIIYWHRIDTGLIPLFFSFVTQVVQTIPRVEFAKRDDFIFWRSDIVSPSGILFSYRTKTDLSFN